MGVAVLLALSVPFNALLEVALLPKLDLTQLVLALRRTRFRRLLHVPVSLDVLVVAVAVATAVGLLVALRHGVQGDKRLAVAHGDAWRRSGDHKP